MKEHLLKFIREELIGEGQSAEIDENQDLLELGLIDSMGLMKIITWIEDELGLQVPEEDVVPDNFQSIASMERLIERLKPAK